MNENPTEEQRRQVDRRRQPTLPLDALRPGGRRRWPRRQEERRGAFFVDRFDALTLAMIVALLGLSLVDGVLTAELLDINSEEINPFMHYLLKHGYAAFFLGKYAMTAVGLPILVVYKNYPMFGSRFRVGFLLPVFLGLYLVLLSYQWALLGMGPREPPTPLGSAAGGAMVRVGPDRTIHRASRSRMSRAHPSGADEAIPRNGADDLRPFSDRWGMP